MQIRKAEPSDLESILNVWRTSSQATYHFLKASHTEKENREYFYQVIAKENDLWVAESENPNSIVGFLAIEGQHIDRLYITPDQQRRGIGSQLLDLARSLSPDELTLNTHQKNTNARAFYESQGFKPIRFGTSPPPENEPDVTYQWLATATEST